MISGKIGQSSISANVKIDLSKRGVAIDPAMMTPRSQEESFFAQCSMDAVERVWCEGS